MRKTKRIYALMASAMLSMAVVGCGSSETIENDMTVEESTEVTTPEADIEVGEVEAESATEETVADEAVVEESTEEANVIVGDDWLSQNGFMTYGVGDFSFTGLINGCYDYGDGSFGMNPSIDKINGTFDVTEVDNGDGTKTVTAVITQYGLIPDEYYYQLESGVFVADRNTDKAFCLGWDDTDTENTFNATQDVTMKINHTMEDATKEGGNRVNTLAVTVPADYDDLVFGVASPIFDFTEENTITTINDRAVNYCDGACEVIFLSAN